MLKINKTLLCLIALIACFTSSAQDFARHNWYFTGNDQAIVFGKDNEANPIIDEGKSAQLNIGEKVTVTNPTTGDLIFYTDGSTIFDATNLRMADGDNILSDPAGIQALSTSPVPGVLGQGQYYLFHRNASGEILYTLVDSNTPGILPSGFVNPSQKNQSTGITNRGDGMITIGSMDMTTFWLITQDLTDSTLQIHEVPAIGGTFNQVGTINLTNPILVEHMAYHQETGQIALIPSNNANIEVLQFTEGGMVGPSLNGVRTILNSFVFGEDFGGSAGWSFSGQFLYFSRNTGTEGNLYRFDMLDMRPEASVETVLSSPIEESLSLQLAPDSTLYHIYRDAPAGDRLLGRINFADS